MVEMTRTAAKCTRMKNARTERAKELFVQVCDNNNNNNNNNNNDDNNNNNNRRGVIESQPSLERHYTYAG